MKHIKTYKIFESKFDDFNEIIDNLHDYTLDFIDDGFVVEIKPDISWERRWVKEPFYLLIKGDNDNSYIKHQKYILNILSIIDYMKSEGYNTHLTLTDSYFKNKYQGYLKEVSPDDLKLKDLTLSKDIKLIFNKIDKN
jgi:hypothetical protein